MSKLYKKTDGYNDATIDVVPKPTNRLGITSLVLGVVALGLSISVVLGLTGPRATVGIVRTSEVLDKYQGASDARSSFADKTMAMQGNLDTLKKELQDMVIAYEGRKNTMSVQEREAQETSLRLKETQVRDYAAAVEEKSAREQQTLTESIIRHVKTAAEQIAQKKGIGVLLAVSDDGLILYHESAVDVTDEVLAQMRLNYRGELKDSTR